MTSVPAQPLSHGAVAIEGDIDRQLLDLFFDRTPMGIAVFDRDRRLVRCNKTWSGFFTHYLGFDESYVAPGRSIYDLLPDDDHALERLVEPVLRGETVRQEATRLENFGVVTYWDVVFAPTFRHGEVVGFVDIVTDATERVIAYQLLERRINAFAAIAASMTVDQPLSATLRSLTATAAEVTDAEACAVLIIDPQRDEVAVFESHGLPPAYGDAVAESWRSGVRSPSRRALEAQQLTIVNEARAEGLGNDLYSPLHRYLQEATWQDMVVVPLDSRGRTLGVIQYYHRKAPVLDEDDRAFLTAIADQAAVAVANAALYAQSERSAALVERQRLARELHDSVSQALFSMTLHARAAQRHLLGGSDEVNAAALAAVEKLTELTQGALAEMRALIFELRPGALNEEGLVAALTRQAAALAARESMSITVSGPAERPVLTTAAEEHLYRIVLEALNNAVKHASASQISVDVTVAGEELSITVADDGVGFDPDVVPAGHMGRSTMAERAATIGGVLTVDSRPGSGCRVRVAVRLLDLPGEGDLPVV
jgi:PAS domain S-box-containing protein